MNLEFFDNIIGFSVKRQLSLLIFLSGSLFLLCYYLFIYPLNLQYQQDRLNYDTLQDELHQLAQKINHYPTEEQFLKKIADIKYREQINSGHSIFSFTQLVSKKLFHYHLKLLNFTRKEESGFTYLQFKICGSYQNFMQFMDYLSTLNFNISVASIFMSKDGESLTFILQLRCDNQSGVSHD